MAAAQRHAGRFMMKQAPVIPQDPANIDFFDICRLLETSDRDRPRIALSRARKDEIVRFGQNPFFAFPNANVTDVGKTEDGVYRVLVRFLGMLGPQGALPLAVTDEAYHYVRGNDDALVRFFDLFNNRFIQLFFRAWANGRALTHRDRGAGDDRFADYLGSFIGIGIEGLKQRDSVPDEAKMAFSGLLGMQTRSASRLRAALASLFSAEVEIEEFVGMRLMFEPEHRSRLGKREFGCLGRDLLIGAGVFSVQDKIRVKITASSLSQYNNFLPVGARAEQLSDFVKFAVGRELEWDVELGLPTSMIEPVRLGQSGRLGWTGWLSPRMPDKGDPVRRDARFDLKQRFHKKRATTGISSAPGRAAPGNKVRSSP